jgi:hypothetical protein
MGLVGQRVVLFLRRHEVSTDEVLLMGRGEV